MRLLADGPLTGSHDPLGTVVQPPQPDTPIPVPVKRSTGLWAGAVLVLAVSLVLLTLGAVIYLDQQRRVTSSAPVPVPVVVSPVPAPSADMTVTATATATTTATATATTTAEAIVPSPSPLVTTQTSTGSVTDAEAEQRLFDLRRVDLPNVAQGAWYASLSTKCAPMTAVDIYGPRGFGFPDGLSESYPGGIGNSTILALAYQYKQTYGDDVRTVIVDDVRPDADEYAQLCGGDFNLPMWVTLHTGVSASNPDVVLEWCRSQGIVSGECGAYPVGLPGEKPRWTT